MSGTGRRAGDDLPAPQPVRAAAAEACDRHGGIGLMTPATVHFGHADAVRAQRQRVLDAAYNRTPERFVRHAPAPPTMPTAAWINKPAPTEDPAH